MKISKNLFFAPLILGSIYFYQNMTVKKSEYNLVNEKIPKSFDGFKIVQLSDVHANKIGYSDQIFLSRLRKENPDIIVLTGDFFDSYNNDKHFVYNFLSQVADIAPCYFVSGNHELRLTEEYLEMQEFFKKLEITHLKNDRIYLKKNNDEIAIVGIEDFNFFRFSNEQYYQAEHRNILKKLYTNNIFNILLAHRPEKFPVYCGVGYDLVFSGHAHGGQWNIPLFGRIFSPSQGFFPKYTHGIYTDGNTTMIVSQGLGNSSFPLRINNRLEMIVVKLSSNNNSNIV